MRKSTKDQSSTSVNPIQINHKAHADLPLPLRELADLLADLAMKQLNEPMNPQGEKGMDDR